MTPSPLHVPRLQFVNEVEQELFVASGVRMHGLHHPWIKLAIIVVHTVNEGVGVHVK